MTGNARCVFWKVTWRMWRSNVTVRVLCCCRCCGFASQVLLVELGNRTSLVIRSSGNWKQSRAFSYYLSVMLFCSCLIFLDNINILHETIDDKRETTSERMLFVFLILLLREEPLYLPRDIYSVVFVVVFCCHWTNKQVLFFRKTKGRTIIADTRRCQDWNKRHSWGTTILQDMKRNLSLTIKILVGMLLCMHLVCLWFCRENSQ